MHRKRNQLEQIAANDAYNIKSSWGGLYTCDLFDRLYTTCRYVRIILF